MIAPRPGQAFLKAEDSAQTESGTERPKGNGSEIAAAVNTGQSACGVTDRIGAAWGGEHMILSCDFWKCPKPNSKGTEKGHTSRYFQPLMRATSTWTPVPRRMCKQPQHAELWISESGEVGQGNGRAIPRPHFVLATPSSQSSVGAQEEGWYLQA